MNQNQFALFLRGKRLAGGKKEQNGNISWIFPVPSPSSPGAVCPRPADSCPTEPTCRIGGAQSMRIHGEIPSLTGSPAILPKKPPIWRRCPCAISEADENFKAAALSCCPLCFPATLLVLAAELPGSPLFPYFCSLIFRIASGSNLYSCL